MESIRLVRPHNIKTSPEGEMECERCGHTVFRLKKTTEDEEGLQTYTVKCNNCGALCECTEDEVEIEEFIQ